jgi:DNA-binding MarR family transcriptional regulator
VSQAIDARRSNTSRAILELKKKGFIICLTPDEKRGRFYKITDIGEKVLQKIENELV